MVVTMNGSPLARPGGFKELQSTTLTRAQREAEKRKAKKAAEEAKFQKRQEAIRQQQNREREERRRAREEGAKIVEAQHEAWEAEQRMREERHRLNVVAGEELTQSKIYESSIGETLDTSNDWQQKELYRQRAAEQHRGSQPQRTPRPYRLYPIRPPTPIHPAQRGRRAASATQRSSPQSSLS